MRAAQPLGRQPKRAAPGTELLRRRKVCGRMGHPGVRACGSICGDVLPFLAEARRSAAAASKELEGTRPGAGCCPDRWLAGGRGHGSHARHGNLYIIRHVESQSSSPRTTDTGTTVRYATMYQRRPSCSRPGRARASPRVGFGEDLAPAKSDVQTLQSPAISRPQCGYRYPSLPIRPPQPFSPPNIIPWSVCLPHGRDLRLGFRLYFLPSANFSVPGKTLGASPFHPETRHPPT